MERRIFGFVKREIGLRVFICVVMFCLASNGPCGV